jgi:hypothetical protein
MSCRTAIARLKREYTTSSERLMATFLCRVTRGFSV